MATVRRYSHQFWEAFCDFIDADRLVEREVT